MAFRRETLWPHAALCATMAPWAPPEADSWLFMDDRSLTTTDASDLQKAIDYTIKFDTDAGADENRKKRQLWRRGERKRIEHIGLSVIPDDPTADVEPRDGWLKISAVVKRIKTDPSCMDVREVLAGAYARSLWNWASPVMAPAPDNIAPEVKKAVIRSQCTWWCAGRWWADRVFLHSHSSAFISASSKIQDPNLVFSVFIESNMAKMCAKLKLKYSAIDKAKGIGISMASEVDQRVTQSTSSFLR